MKKIIHILCEGQTEQGFVEGVLKPYLLYHGVDAVKSILVTTNKKKNARGGMTTYGHAKNDLGLMCLSNHNCDYQRHVFTTMFDLYALPDDFPTYASAQKIVDKYQRVKFLEQSFKSDINEERFIPYIQLHEFEALVLCGIDYLKDLYPNSDKRCEKLRKALAEKSNNPELVNDKPTTAPSKRIIEVIEGAPKVHYSYNKPKTGKYITSKIGIEKLRSMCAHFNEWVENLINC